MTSSRDDILKELQEFGVSESRILKLDSEFDKFIEDLPAYDLESEDIHVALYNIFYPTMIRCKDNKITLSPLHVSIVEAIGTEENAKITKNEKHWYLPMSESKRDKMMKDAGLNPKDWKWTIESDSKSRTLTEDKMLYKAIKKKKDWVVFGGKNYESIG